MLYAGGFGDEERVLVNVVLGRGAVADSIVGAGRGRGRLSLLVLA